MSMNRIKKINFSLQTLYSFLELVDGQRNGSDIFKRSDKLSMSTIYNYMSILHSKGFLNVRRVGPQLIPSLTDKGQRLREILKDLVEGGVRYEN